MKKLGYIFLVFVLLLSSCNSNGSSTGNSGNNSNNGNEGEKEKYLISFSTGLGSDLNSITIVKGNKLNVPEKPIRLGFSFEGWFIDEACNTPYDFSLEINESFTLYAKWASNSNSTFDEIDFSGLEQGKINLGSGKVKERGSVNVTSVSGVYEGAYLEFEEINNANYNIYLGKDNNYTLLDYKNVYIRKLDNGLMRADLLGLKSGDYDIKITSLINGSEGVGTICSVSIEEYDRSGYAHFNYTDGIGGYNDDGTLKDDALIIYVTDENKDYIMGEIPEISQYMFNIPDYFSNKWNGKEAKGIGWWLNNTQYSKSEKDSSGNPIPSKSSNTYSPNGSKLGFNNICQDRPIVIRFVGTVTAPEGLTAYDSYDEGGSLGDNGYMARMKDLRNITLEGVGNDAVIKGWGIHFIANDRSGEYGKSFEVRNITFTEYPEDAIGMEGVQEGSKLVAPVERCWIHHCTFLPGYCANPAESDKGEGDGSCDFKRGQYYTMSYCYYENCHKTNLVGSSDSSLQYNISFHHNVWYNCASRIPLLRRANIHFYNNYVYGNANDNSISLSYVTSLRASSYMYSENNYFEGCKQVFDSKDGGAAKCFGNTYLACYNSNSVLSKNVNSREESVSSDCKYLDIDYSNFDTNSSLFYYDAENKMSDCYLTTSDVAKVECIRFAGSYYRTIANKCVLANDKIEFNEYDVDGYIDLSAGNYNAVIGTNDNGISFTGVKSSKFRGQGVTFNLNGSAIIDVSISSSSSEALYGGYVVSSTGKVMLYGSGKTILPKGKYYIISGQVNKDSVISSLSFEKYDEEIFEEDLLNNIQIKINEFPKMVEYTEEYYYKALEILSIYQKLSKEDKEKINMDSVLKGYNNYLALGRDYVNSLISSIGEIDINSGNAINSARNAYNEYHSIASFVDIDITKLIDAENKFKNFAVESCINKINKIQNIDLSSKEIIELARDEYESLEEDQKSLITNYEILVEAEKRLNILEKAHEFDELVQNVEDDLNSLEEVFNGFYLLNELEVNELKTLNKISEIRVKYLTLMINEIGIVDSNSGAIINKAISVKDCLSEEELSKVLNLGLLTKAIEEFNLLQGQQHVMIFDNGLIDPTGYFTISGNMKNSVPPKTYNGITYTTAMKIESSTTIKFIAEKNTKLVIVSDAGAGAKVKVNGITYISDNEGVFIIDISSGENVITKSTSMNVYTLVVG